MPADSEFWRGRRVLVTGNTGFKGSWLVLWLSALGARITGFADGMPTTPSLHELARLDELAVNVRGDVRDVEAVRSTVEAHRPEVIFHLAAQPIVRRSFAAPVETFATNVMGTVNVLEAVRVVGGVAAVVIVTSDKCYENREWEWPYREYEPMGGTEPYSASKACAELVTHAYRHSFFSAADGARVATARAGNVIGGGDWAADRLIPDVMRAAMAGTPIAVRNPDSQRPWQHVLNPLSGYLTLAETLSTNAGEHAGAWNFGPRDEDARSVRWVIGRLAEFWPGPLRWEVDASAHPPEAQLLKLDSSRARVRLGWQPAWDLDTALQSIVTWYARFQEGADMRAVTRAQVDAFEAASIPAP